MANANAKVVAAMGFVRQEILLGMVGRLYLGGQATCLISVRKPSTACVLIFLFVILLSGELSIGV